MPLAPAWTDAQDAQIRRLRAEGAAWDDIARAIGCAPEAAMARARAIVARPPPADFSPPADDPDREPLPAGHPRSWDAIVSGTVLDGCAYPLPFFPQ